MTEQTNPKQPKVDLEAHKDEQGKLHVEVKFPDEHKQVFAFDASHPLYERFAVHGVGKKVRDTIQTIKEPAKQKEAVAALFKAFEAGTWNAHRAEGGTGAGTGVLARALAALYGKPIAESQEFVSKLSKKQQSDMRRIPEVAAKITELNKPSDEAAEDVKGLLAEFTA